jgi:hypothetical protein
MSGKIHASSTISTWIIQTYPPAAIRVDATEKVGSAKLRAIAGCRIPVAVSHMCNLGVIRQRRETGLLGI